MIILKNISKSYCNNSNVLNSINLQINGNTITSIVGKSGCGKSTLLNIIGGLDIPSSGSVIVSGLDITKMSERVLSSFRSKNIGFVFQFFNLIPELNVLENIMFPSVIQKRKADKEYIDYLIEKMELNSLRLRIPSQLSGGEQQRVAIARAIAAHPKLVLMDEPTGNLDEKNTQIVCDLIKSMKKELNQTIVFVTHDHEVSNIADCVLKLRDGFIGDESI